MKQPEHDPLLAGLKEAILAEQAGIQFYTTAAANTADERGRDVFQMLAAEEEKHRDYLRRQYKNILEGSPVEPLTAAPALELSGPSPIFSEELKRRVGEAHWEMTALSVGLQLEQASIERYRRLAGETDRPEAARFFEELARWEETHAAALRRQSRFLLEDYWNEARFAPF